MRKILLFINLTYCLLLVAQQSDYIDIGNVKALVNADGVLFYDTLNNQSSFEVPKNSGTHTIYASGFIISSTNIITNFPHYGVSQNVHLGLKDFKIGPIHLRYQQPELSNQFQRLWKITKLEIDNHIQLWNTSNYVAPNSILDWPGNGNVNTANNLAPYNDIDNDGVYEPLDGEYPVIKGDQAIFLMLNNFNKPANPAFEILPIYDTSGNIIGLDTISLFSASGKTPLELHVMVYAYKNQSKEIDHTVFTHVKLFNRALDTLGDIDELKFSIYSDFDIGNAFDDYIGTDTNRNMFYAYNADNFDESTFGRTGYESNLATQAIKFLDYPISSTMPRQAVSTGINPEQTFHFRWYQNNLWRNGSHLYYGGSGFSSSQGCTDITKPVNYIYSGDPGSPNDSTQWTEFNPCFGDTTIVNPSGDRQILGSPALYPKLNNRESVEFNYAYVFAQDSNGIVASVKSLQVAADSVQAFYDRMQFVGTRNISLEKIEFDLYPNPSNLIVNIKIEEKKFFLQLFSSSGVLLKQGYNLKKLNLEIYDSGIYFISVNTEKGKKTKKLVIAK